MKMPVVSPLVVTTSWHVALHVSFEDFVSHSGIKGNHNSKYQCSEYQCHKNGVATDEKISSEATGVGNTPDRKW
jgi:hypothetical protein